MTATLRYKTTTPAVDSQNSQDQGPESKLEPASKASTTEDNGGSVGSVNSRVGGTQDGGGKDFTGPRDDAPMNGYSDEYAEMASMGLIDDDYSLGSGLELYKRERSPGNDREAVEVERVNGGEGS